MTLKRHLVAALLVLILFSLVGVGWLIWRNLHAATDSEQLETQTREVIQQLGNLLSSLKDTETGQRGYIITGRPDYPEPYQFSLAEIATGLTDSRRLTADEPRQQQRLDAITPLVEAKLADLKETIALRETQGSEAASAAVATQTGRKLMGEIRVLVAQAQAEEAQLLTRPRNLIAWWRIALNAPCKVQVKFTGFAPVTTTKVRRVRIAGF